MRFLIEIPRDMDENMAKDAKGALMDTIIHKYDNLTVEGIDGEYDRAVQDAGLGTYISFGVGEYDVSYLNEDELCSTCKKTTPILKLYNNKKVLEMAIKLYSKTAEIKRFFA